jgi:hypothetical protein
MAGLASPNAISASLNCQRPLPNHILFASDARLFGGTPAGRAYLALTTFQSLNAFVTSDTIRTFPGAIASLTGRPRTLVVRVELKVSYIRMTSRSFGSGARAGAISNSTQTRASAAWVTAGAPIGPSRSGQPFCPFSDARTVRASSAPENFADPATAVSRSLRALSFWPVSNSAMPRW